MLGVVLADRRNVTHSLGLVILGAMAAVLIGYLVGLVVARDVVADNNSQVAGRVNPRLIDMLAALATGVVGSVAACRESRRLRISSLEAAPFQDERWGLA